MGNKSRKSRSLLSFVEEAHSANVALIYHNWIIVPLDIVYIAGSNDLCRYTTISIIDVSSMQLNDARRQNWARIVCWCVPNHPMGVLWNPQGGLLLKPPIGYGSLLKPPPQRVELWKLFSWRVSITKQTPIGLHFWIHPQKGFHYNCCINYILIQPSDGFLDKLRIKYMYVCSKTSHPKSMCQTIPWGSLLKPPLR